MSWIDCVKHLSVGTRGALQAMKRIIFTFYMDYVVELLSIKLSPMSLSASGMSSWAQLRSCSCGEDFLKTLMAQTVLAHILVLKGSVWQSLPNYVIGTTQTLCPLGKEVSSG
jgi:hypothetical protein